MYSLYTWTLNENQLGIVLTHAMCLNYVLGDSERIVQRLHLWEHARDKPCTESGCLLSDSRWLCEQVVSYWPGEQQGHNHGHSCYSACQHRCDRCRPHGCAILCPKGLCSQCVQCSAKPELQQSQHVSNGFIHSTALHLN